MLMRTSNVLQRQRRAYGRFSRQQLERPFTRNEKAKRRVIRSRFLPMIRHFLVFSTPSYVRVCAFLALPFYSILPSSVFFPLVCVWVCDVTRIGTIRSPWNACALICMSPHFSALFWVRHHLNPHPCRHCSCLSFGRAIYCEICLAFFLFLQLGYTALTSPSLFPILPFVLMGKRMNARNLIVMCNVSRTRVYARTDSHEKQANTTITVLTSRI